VWASPIWLPKRSQKTGQLGNSPALHCLIFFNCQVAYRQQGARSTPGTPQCVLCSEGLVWAACAQMVVGSRPSWQASALSTAVPCLLRQWLLRVRNASFLCWIFGMSKWRRMQVTSWQEVAGPAPAIQHQPPGAETESVKQCKDCIHCWWSSKYAGVDVCTSTV
jgi:hypothetical protein